MGGRTTTILVTDFVGSTDLLVLLGDERFDAVRRRQFALVRGAVGDHGGRELRGTGDGLVIELPTASAALQCAAGIQAATEREHRRLPDATMRLRAGVAVGEGGTDGVEDPAVVEATRLSAAAAGGQIVVAEPVVLLAGGASAGATPGPLPGTLLLEVDAEAGRPGLPRPLAIDDHHLPLVGRSDALARLEATWRGSGPAVATVSAEPGSGRTRLVAELARRAHGEGGLVLYGRADRLTGAPYQAFADACRGCLAAWPPGAFDEALGPYGTELGLLVPSAALRYAPPRPVGIADEVARHRLFEAVTRLLRAASGRASVLLVLEDLQWATGPTIGMLRHLLSGPGGMGGAVVLTHEADLPRGHPLRELLADLGPAVERLALEPLDPGDIAELVAQLGAAEDPVELHQRTGGSPLLLADLLTDHDPAGSPGPRTGTVATAGVLARRLARLSPEACRTVEAAALLGDDPRLSVLERVEGLGGPDAVLDAMDEAVRAGLVDELDGWGGYRFAGSSLRSAVEDGLGRSLRVDLHRRLGEALLAAHGQDDAHAAAVAHHLLEAAAGGDPGPGIAAARRAADVAMRAHAAEDAVAFLLRALDADRYGPADHLRRAGVLVDLGRAHMRVGDPFAAKEAAARAADLVEPVERGDEVGAALLLDAACVHAAYPVAGVPDPRVLELCRAALNTVPAPDGVRAAELLAHIANHELWGEGDGARAADTAAQAVAVARASGDRTAVGRALYAAGVALLPTNDPAAGRAVAEELLAVAEEVDDDHLRGLGHEARAVTRLVAGDAVGFEADVDAVAVLGESMPYWLFRANAAMWRGGLLLLRGDLEGAEREAMRALAESDGRPDFVGSITAQMLVLRREQGRIEELAGMVAGAAATAPTISAFRVAAALVDAEAGRVDDAGRAVRALAEGGAASLRHDLSHLLSLVLLAEACGELGDVHSAAELEPALAPAAGLVATAAGVVTLGAVDRSLGILAAVQGRHDDAVPRYRSALELEERMGAEPAAVRTLLWLARSQAALGDSGAAAASRATALDRAHAHGLVHLADRLVAELV